MEATRRFWGLPAIAGVLATLAVVFNRPLLLFGTGGITALVVVRQYRFLRTLQRTDAALSVDQILGVSHVKKGDETQVTLSASLAVPSTLELEIEATPPLFADAPASGGRTVTLNPGDTDANSTFGVSWPIVGHGSFEPATVTATSPDGLFRETLLRGTAPAVTVDPRLPRNLHVGEGGDRAATSYGGHRSEQTGQGSDPAELRQYVPGDTLSDIDWKATARLDYPHVREYEVETDRQTFLVVDHRGDLASGPTGETKFDHLREVALTIAKKADELNDPLGLAGVGTQGMTAWKAPGTSPDVYKRIREELQSLTPHEKIERVSPSGGGHGVATARRKAGLLAGENSAFSGQLRPFFEDSSGHVQRMESDQMFQTVKSRLGSLPGESWICIFTDDTDRVELLETVKLAAKDAGGVSVFLTPNLLFDGNSITNVDDTYAEYVEFEDFRRELARIDGVSAYEVGPADRVEAVLAAGQRQRG